MNILIFVIILLVLVIVHEAGHFFSAKWFGIRVDEFGFGFPPKIFGFKKGETEYTLNALPFGGFVKIFGESPDADSISGPDAARSFVNKAKWKQAVVLVAGVFANFLLAWLLFSFGFMWGLPTSVGSHANSSRLTNIHLVVISVLPKSPAEKAGLPSGATINSVTSDKDVLAELNPEGLKGFILAHPNKPINISYTGAGNNDEKTVSVTPLPNEAGKPAIGISMDEIGVEKLPFYLAFWEGLKLDWNMVKGTAYGLYSLIHDALVGKGSLAGVTGPVGIVGIVGDAYKLGFAYILSFAALISVNLAIINLLPFPALDGGRVLFLIIEKIKGSAINPKVANTINMIGFAILIIFMLFITYHDVAKLL
jgi:regulator of sigma E protease